jgi:hypothetical protein
MTTTSQATQADTVDPGAEAIPPELRIVEWQNEWIVRSAYEYDYQAKDDMLVELREKYELDAVVAGGRTEFEQMLMLKEWVRNRWDHGWSREPEARNALEILEAAELGSDFNCGYYSVTMMQSLLALGFVARRAGIAKAQSEWMALDEGNIGHSVPEVYSHDFHKWILLDADTNVHYELDGTPLSVLEIHRAWVGGRWSEVKLVTGAKPFKRTEKTSSGLLSVYDTIDEHDASGWVFRSNNVGDYYANASVYLGNTHHSRGGPMPMLHWTDERTPPRLISANNPNKEDWTGNEHDMYPTIDQVQINLRAEPEAWERREALLSVNLEDSMPNLDKLLVRIDHEPWTERGRDFTWKLKPGKNEIMAKGVNTFGRDGHISRILLRFHP